jgi:lipopolysaccharide transport system permease protein
LTWRQIGVQYKQAILGIGWAVISPLMSTVVFTVIFGKLAAIPSEGLPYPLFVLSGLITWQYFARAITAGSNSIVGNSAAAAPNHPVADIFLCPAPSRPCGQP